VEMTRAAIETESAAKLIQNARPAGAAQASRRLISRSTAIRRQGAAVVFPTSPSWVLNASSLRRRKTQTSSIGVNCEGFLLCQRSSARRHSLAFHHVLNVIDAFIPAFRAPCRADI